MPPIIALSACIVLVAVLLIIEHKKNLTASTVLWIPTVWMLICASRPVGAWFLGNTVEGGFEEGSPLDRLVLIVLIGLSLLVISKRKVEWKPILKDNYWLIILYLYLGFSILWSDYTFVSFKRWFRLLGAIPVAMVVVSERSPFEALVSLFRRCAYILIPFSIILIKYYPSLGVGYSRWSGVLMWEGVTLTKNALGQLCLLVVFFIIWNYFREKRTILNSNQRAVRLADGFILFIAIYLLAGTPSGAYSATSIATLSIFIISVVILYRFEKHAKGLSAILISLIVVAGLCLMLFEPFVKEITLLVGRDETLTGRTDIWAMCLESATQHPILGTGFGSYFGTNNEFTRTFGNTGHNGFLDVYVEAGIVGVIFLLLFLLSFYKHTRWVFNKNFDWGIFGICLLGISLLTNYTESLFLKASSLIWNSIIYLTIVFSALFSVQKE